MVKILTFKKIYFLKKIKTIILFAILRNNESEDLHLKIPVFKNIIWWFNMGLHSFSTYAKFSDKLTYLTPWYEHGCKKCKLFEKFPVLTKWKSTIKTKEILKGTDSLLSLNMVVHRIDQNLTTYISIEQQAGLCDFYRLQYDNTPCTISWFNALHPNGHNEYLTFTINSFQLNACKGNKNHFYIMSNHPFLSKCSLRHFMAWKFRSNTSFETLKSY